MKFQTNNKVHKTKTFRSKYESPSPVQRGAKTKGINHNNMTKTENEHRTTNEWANTSARNATIPSWKIICHIQFPTSRIINSEMTNFFNKKEQPIQTTNLTN